MRIVLDTNILVRANIKARGPAREILLKIAYSDHVLITSPFLLRETQRCLAYPRLQKLWRLSQQDIQEHIELLENLSELVHPIIEHPVVLKDASDDAVVYTALTGNADVLCTLDRDFSDPDVKEFCQKRGVSVLNDVESLRRLREPLA